MHDGAGQRVNQEKAAEAVKCFSELWGSGSFDCGPQDYEYMTKQCIEACELPEVRRRLNNPTVPLAQVKKELGL